LPDIFINDASLEVGDSLRTPSRTGVATAKRGESRVSIKGILLPSAHFLTHNFNAGNWKLATDKKWQVELLLTGQRTWLVSNACIINRATTTTTISMANMQLPIPLIQRNGDTRREEKRTETEIQTQTRIS